MSNQALENIEVKCFCGAQFTWTKGEQAFMNDLFAKGRIEEVQQPKRCPECRLKKKERFKEQDAQQGR